MGARGKTHLYVKPFNQTTIWLYNHFIKTATFLLIAMYPFTNSDFEVNTKAYVPLQQNFVCFI